MADIDRALSEREARKAAVVMGGLVSTAPVGPDAPLLVTLDAYGHRSARFEAWGWSPRGDQEPSAGDRVWVVRADDHELVVVAWHPSAIDSEE